MHAEDHVIHFSTELIHAPIKHKVPALQKLYYDLSQTRAAYDSSDFSTPAQYRFYSKRGSKTQSIILFLPDRVVLIEEWSDVTVSEFNEKVREVARRMLSSFGIQSYGAQTATVRSTFVLSYFKDARVFLMDHACQQINRIGPHFRRPIAVGGLRFVLPETPENPGAFHIILESFQHSLNEVFVEVKGIYLNLHIDTENIESTAANVQRARTFITDNVYPYLNQYDEPQGEG